MLTDKENVRESFHIVIPKLKNSKKMTSLLEEYSIKYKVKITEQTN